MTDRTLPLLFLNLGGEMMYILEDRLKAQRVTTDKARKVLHDIIAMMLNERFVEELFKPQELYNKQALKALFENLAHTSIMRLNRPSMNKLYDLMVMVVKYQIYSVLRPQDILLVTMNHFEALASSHPSACLTRLIENFHSRFITMYASMQSGELQTIRHCILNYLQDEKVRVSVLLRERLQNPDGKFVLPTSGPVPAGYEVPVIIRLFNADGSVRSQKSFPSGGQYQQCGEAGSLGLNKKHCTTLGLNMYVRYKAGYSSQQEEKHSIHNTSELQSEFLMAGLPVSGSSVGYEELNLLARLLGPSKTGTHELQLDLFSDQQEEEEYVQQRIVAPALLIDARNQGQTQELAAVYQELSLASMSNVTTSDSSEDLLQLIDSA
ncbi:hypothetical protein B566_EDAN002535 [Ephemera danica]|nr:hypothetical protein B566_EDAN002535 [Ephemera danica]